MNRADVEDKKNTLIAVLEDMFGPAVPVDISHLDGPEKLRTLSHSCITLMEAVIWTLSDRDVSDALRGVDALSEDMKKTIRGRAQ
jgi:hypothetical protein